MMQGKRGFLGDCRKIRINIAGQRKGLANVTTQKDLCFLRFLCVANTKNRRKERRLSGLALQRERRKQRFLGYCREISINLAGQRKGLANVTTPKDLCFLRFLCVSRFMVLILVWSRLLLFSFP